MNEWVAFWTVMVLAFALCVWHEIEKGANS